MKIIVGLGNPLPQYQDTRHNFGQAVVSSFQKENTFPAFKFKRKINCLISEGKIDSEKIALVLPQTFMNESGKAIKKLISISNFKLQISNLWIIHDDINLSLGRIRIKTSGSAGGHKGVQSIIDHLKTEAFIRFKIGIRSPEETHPNTLAYSKEDQGMKQNHVICLPKFVLAKFKQQERKIAQEVIEKTLQAIKLALKQGIEKAMNQYN